MHVKKPSAFPAASMLLQMAAHTAMGVAFGLAFAFILTHVAQLGLVAHIQRSVDPQAAMTMLVLACVTTFGIGTTLTGLALTVMDKG